MHRRSLLRTAGTALAAVGIAGCLGRAPASRHGGGGSGTDPTASETDARSTTPTAEPPSETPVDGTDTETTTGETGAPPKTDTATPEPVSRPRLVETAFEVRSVGPGDQSHEAAVSIDGKTVVVEGKIPGANGCHTAELAAADHENGLLTVLVRSYEDAEEDTACTQSIVEIDYRADCTFEGTLPDTVQVDHRAMGERKTVTTTSVE